MTTSVVTAPNVIRKKRIERDPEERLAELVADLEGEDAAEHRRQAAPRRRGPSRRVEK